jgi:hypothetical protein
VLAIDSGSISIVFDGILRKFRFREVGDELAIHSCLGSRVVYRLPRYARPKESSPAKSQAVPSPSKALATAAANEGK